MASLCYQYLSIVANDFIFFSSNVQTTTIAVAIASSLCYSIVWAICHIVRFTHSPDQRENDRRKSVTPFSYLPNMGARFTVKRPKSSAGGCDLISFETVLCRQLEVPCVRCSKYLADPQCRFVTCKLCCFCPDVCSLHKPPCDLECRPYDHLKFSAITEINLSECQITQCPERIGYFGSQLSLLNLSGNNLCELPEEIGCLRGLKEFYLQKNSITILPTTLKLLTNLQILVVSSNRLQSLPDFWLMLYGLHLLDVSHNEICSLPDSMRHLRHLHTLMLQNNQLTNIPENLCQLKELKKFDVSDNSLESMPTFLGGFLRLEEFSADSCNLNTFPMFLCQCPSLHTLNLSRNRLKVIPVKVGVLRNLKELNLSHNCLQYLPATLHISQLRICYISENPFLMEADQSSIQSLTQGPCDTGNVPLLFELASRKVVSDDGIQYDLKSLPLCLQESLRQAKMCTTCGVMFVDLYQSCLHFQRHPNVSIPILSHVCCSRCATNL